ncbi:MAG TPA: tRNA lysidine(34) synthetase TilS, partial [Candidatus Dormibacteraeota bacterium]|nr:tRNA lysidine(34) synthetase TilS [Candidatus Dormibacteraeota bacterium]
MKNTAGTLERQVRRTIARYDMLRAGERVLVAVSGGPDSTALLSILHRLGPEMNLDLHVAHLDHGWRGRASARDAEFVRRLGVRLGLPVTVGHLGPRVWQLRGGRQSSREARARELRSSFLRETAREVGAQKVALGHTRDDQAESFLMRLLRGSGPRGLAGTYPVVDGVIIRPLIDTRRRDLLAYLRERHLSYRVDATNRDPSLTRNRIRRRLLPLLQKQFNPNAVEALAHAADLLRDEDHYLGELAQEKFRDIATRRGESVVLRARAIQELPVPLRRRILRLALAEARGDLRRIALQHVEQSLSLLEERRRRGRVSLPDGTAVDREGEHLRIAPRATPAGPAPGAGQAASPREALCPVPGEVALPGFGLRLRATVVARAEAPIDLRTAGKDRAYLDADLLPGPLLIRPRRPGDRFVPLGAPGTRKVKSFLIDRKVPVDERGRIPLVLSGDRIAWVVEHEIDDRFKV